MDDKDLIIGGVLLGGILYLVYKKEIAPGVAGVAGGVGNAVSGVGNAVGTTGNELAQTISAVLDPYQALSKRLVNLIEGKGSVSSSQSGFYAGSPSGTVELSQTQVNSLLKSSGISSMPQVLNDLKSVNGKVYSPLFVGGSIDISPTTPTSQTTAAVTKAANKGSSSSSSIRTPLSTGGYKITGAKNIKLR